MLMVRVRVGLDEVVCEGEGTHTHLCFLRTSSPSSRQHHLGLGLGVGLGFFTCGDHYIHLVTSVCVAASVRVVTSLSFMVKGSVRYLGLLLVFVLLLGLGRGVVLLLGLGRG